MKVVSRKQTKEFKNNEVCTAVEYPLNDKDINGTIIKLNGRYPSRGRVMNTKCKEMAYIIKGKGIVYAGGKKVKLATGDLVLLEPNDKYYWEGNMEMFVPCTPAWYPKQHKVVK